MRSARSEARAVGEDGDATPARDARPEPEVKAALSFRRRALSASG